MNTKTLMTSSSLILAVAGIFTLFAPDVLLSALGVAVTAQLAVLVQLLGALYFSFALMNWTAKDSAIGGIYARPVSLANFSHFFVAHFCLLNIYSPTNSIFPFYWYRFCMPASPQFFTGSSFAPQGSRRNKDPSFEGCDYQSAHL